MEFFMSSPEPFPLFRGEIRMIAIATIMVSIPPHPPVPTRKSPRNKEGNEQYECDS